MTIEIQNLSVNYGAAPVVKDLNLSIGDSEILMLLGPTGCGKTTILRALAGLVPVASGEIRMGDRTIDRDHFLPPEKRNVGMVFQDFALFPHLNVERNIGFRLQDKALADFWIHLLRLGPLRWAMPDTLSGGQKQRVALARALAHKPGIMLLDEPLSNLDAALKDSLRWTIREALKEAGVPAVWVTHDQDEAMSVGDRVGILKDGRLEQVDTPENCFANPATRFVAEFLGEACFFPGTVEGDRARTSLGPAQVHSTGEVQGDADILVRPDDLTIAAGDDTNATVSWARFEGGTRLFAANVGGEHEVRIRTGHESMFEPGDPVRVELTANHPLVAFSRSNGKKAL